MFILPSDKQVNVLFEGRMEGREERKRGAGGRVNQGFHREQV